MQSIEPVPWYDDREGVVYALPPLKCHYPLLYLRTKAEDQLLKWNLMLRSDSLQVARLIKGGSNFIQSDPLTMVMVYISE